MPPWIRSGTFCIRRLLPGRFPVVILLVVLMLNLINPLVELLDHDIEVRRFSFDELSKTL